VGVTNREVGLPALKLVGSAIHRGGNGWERIEVSRETSPTSLLVVTVFHTSCEAPLRVSLHRVPSISRPPRGMPASLGSISGGYWYTVFQSLAASDFSGQVVMYPHPQRVSTRFRRFTVVPDDR